MTFSFIEDPQQVIFEIETKRIIVLQKDVKILCFIYKIILSLLSVLWSMDTFRPMTRERNWIFQNSEKLNLDLDTIN